MLLPRQKRSRPAAIVRIYGKNPFSFLRDGFMRRVKPGLGLPGVKI